MELSIIDIGNSKGIRLPKNILEKYNIKESIELIPEKEYMILKPIQTPRKGWEKAFKEMSKNEDDQLLIDDIFENENIEAGFKTVSS